MSVHMALSASCTDWSWQPLNTLRSRQNGHHFADNIFKCIFLNENVSILIRISLKFVPKGPMNNIPALVREMAWCQATSHYLNQCWLDYRCIYASLGLKELMPVISRSSSCIWSWLNLKALCLRPRYYTIYQSRNCTYNPNWLENNHNVRCWLHIDQQGLGIWVALLVWISNIFAQSCYIMVNILKIHNKVPTLMYRVSFGNCIKPWNDMILLKLLNNTLGSNLTSVNIVIHGSIMIIWGFMSWSSYMKLCVIPNHIRNLYCINHIDYNKIISSPMLKKDKTHDTLATRWGGPSSLS